MHTVRFENSTIKQTDVMILFCCWLCLTRIQRSILRIHCRVILELSLTCLICLSDSSIERWCEEHFLSYGALQMADAVRTDLTEILKRLELPVSGPAFGSQANTLNIKLALLAGFFMQVQSSGSA